MGTFCVGEVAKQAKLDRGKAASTSQFDFGGNWCDFAANHLSVQRIEEARRDFRALTSGIDLESTTFLDVGFGQGLGSLFAEEMGAKVVGIDSNPKCFEAVEVIRKAFPNDVGKNLDLVVGSILSVKDVEMLRAKTSRGYDVVHAWGVLHHTGKMAEAFANCAKLLSGEGHFIVAIYNAHWSSPFWKKVKHLYCLSGRKTRKTMIWLFAPLVFGAKMLVKKGSPFDKERGMDFIVDLVDWVGGYPYEWATVEQIVDLGKKHDLQIVRVIPANVPTGCNQFVFRRKI